MGHPLKTAQFCSMSTSQIFGKCFPIFFVALCLFYIITWSVVFPVIIHETSSCHPCVAHVSFSDQRFL